MKIETSSLPWVPRVSWGGIFAGLVAGLGIQILLTLLGTAVGLSAIDPRESDAMGGIPLGTGIWTGFSMLVSAFVGGYVAARMSGFYARTDGMFHGFATWGATQLMFAVLATTAVAGLIGGTLGILGQGLKGIGQGVASAAGAVGQTSTTGSDVRTQLESILQATGKPELQPEALQQDAEQLQQGATEAPQAGAPPVTEQALTELQEKLGALDREAAVNVMINRMGFSRERAEQVADQGLALFGQGRAAAQQLPAQAREAAARSVEMFATASWWLFAASFFSLILSAIGGTIGVRGTVVVDRQEEAYRRVAS